ncbi:hypothetical protein RQP46_002525 [Phenoliferia psychrophenolica]
MSFTQEPHKLLVIPGPVECSDEVLYANAHPSMSHVSPAFAPVFGYCLRALRKVVYTETAQPFIIAGSGTLGWDLVAANLIEAGEKALVLNSGYFGDAFADCFEAYGIKADQLGAPVGGRPALADIEAALKKEKYAVLTFTHVDTSTGVLSDAKGIAEIVKRVSPSTVVVLDGVCSVASEEIRMDAWGIDVIIGASQKGLSTPPGLSVTVVSQKALKVLADRKTPVAAYFASYKRWLPIMQSYEAGAPAYFATPPVNLIYAFEASLKIITEGPISLEQRFQTHRDQSAKFKAAALALGFKHVATDPSTAANGMTAVYVPDGIAPAALIGALGARNIVIAGGLHKDIKTRYIRFGHLGHSAISTDHVDQLIAGLQAAHAEVAGQ